ncbi:MAG: hypothetical protein GXP24_12205 [Planctomycetes bacterium]|nr:hypothetical protein [Planctomycetota bacterium]
MFRSMILGLAVLAGLTLAGASTAEAGDCGSYSRGYSGGYYPSYRTSYYYGGLPQGGYYHQAPSVVYHRSYYGGHPSYYGGHHGGHHSGVSFSFGF